MEAIRPERTRLSHLMLIAGSAAALVLGFYLAGPSAPAPGPASTPAAESAQGANLLDRLEYRTVDWRFRTRRPSPDPRLLILEVADPDLQRLGKWPWPHATWARVTDLLTRAGARAVIFDIFFAEPEGPGGTLSVGDEAFVAATRRAGMVYHAAFASPAAAPGRAGSSDPLSIPVRAVPGKGFAAGAYLGNLPGVQAPFPRLAAAAAGLGFADLPDTGDGVFRYVWPVATVGATASATAPIGQVCPSLALCVARQTLAPAEAVAVELGSQVAVGSAFGVPLDRAGRMVINFTGPHLTYPRAHVADLLEGKLTAGAVQDKLVFVAATAPGLYDLRPSPYGAYFDGVEAQANVLDNMLTGRYLMELPPERVVFLVLVMALLAAAAFWAMRPWFAFLAVTGLLLAYELGTVWAFSARSLILPALVPALSTGLGLVGLLVYAVRLQERATRSAHRALGRYVAAEVVQRLEDRDYGAAQGTRRTATILFSDLRNFTGSSARLKPEEVVALLNRYFSLMYETISDFEGTLDKYMGDGLMAYFLAAEGDGEHAVLAVQAALEMQRRIEVYRDEWAFFGMPDLRAGFGLATGEEILGDIGSPDRMQYTLIGPEVNLAARLVELTKTSGADIIMDQRTYELAKDYVGARCLGPVQISGLEQPQVLYEAVPDQPTPTEA